jgi:hypothetical protein
MVNLLHLNGLVKKMASRKRHAEAAFQVNLIPDYENCSLFVAETLSAFFNSKLLAESRMRATKKNVIAATVSCHRRPYTRTP